MKQINLNIMDFVKIIVFAIMTAIGYQANTNVGNISDSADQMQQEMKALKAEMKQVNGTLIEIVTTQTNMIKTIDDHENRIRVIEKIK